MLSAFCVSMNDVTLLLRRLERGLADARRILALSAHFILSVNKESEPFEIVTDEAHHVLSMQHALDGPERIPIQVLPLNKGKCLYVYVELLSKYNTS